MLDDSYLDELDRKCLNLSASLGNIFDWTYGMLGYRLIAPLDPNKFDNASSQIKEIGIRTMIVLGAAASIVFTGLCFVGGAVILGAGSKLFRAAAFYFQKEGFTHIQGRGPEATLKGQKATVVNWDVGGNHKEGLLPWSSRIDGIVQKIQEVNGDVIVLQGVRGAPFVEGLVERLKDDYPHFFAHMGEGTWSEGSGVMIITRCAIHHFSHTSFKQQEGERNLGYETLEIKASPNGPPCARIIGTQITSQIGGGEERMSGIAQIVDGVAKRTIAMPTLCAASCRFNSDLEWDHFSKYLHHSYRGKEPTHSDQLASEWAPSYFGGEFRDCISFFKRTLENGTVLPVVEKEVRLVDSYLVEGFDPQNPSSKTAFAAHHAIVTTFKGLKAS